jgi:hypothetical protein
MGPTAPPQTQVPTITTSDSVTSENTAPKETNQDLENVFAQQDETTIEAEVVETHEDSQTTPSMGFDSATTNQISFNQASDQEATRSLWVAHGILMGLAWGIFVPLGIGAAYLRKLNFLQTDALWICLHFYCSVTAVIFTTAGFAFAVMATNLDGDLPHFKDDVHHKAGLAIFILVFVQVLAGYFRPDAPKAADVLDDGLGAEEKKVDKTPDAVEQLPSSKSNKKTPIRQYWEYFHRFLGMTLLALAWYNCTTGIILQAENYEQDDQKQLMDIFWGITGTIAGSIVFVGYVIRAA